MLKALRSPVPRDEPRQGVCECKHTIQTSGHGQFRGVQYQYGPVKLGGGFQFVTDKSFWGSIPKNFISGVRRRASSIGAARISRRIPRSVDFFPGLTFSDGKVPDVDSSEGPFKIS